MNNVLQVKLTFNNEGNDQKPGARNLRSKASVSVEKIDELINSLKYVQQYYSIITPIVSGVLVDVRYNDIIAKSSRIRELLKPERIDINKTVRGARFSDDSKGEECHIITHYVPRKVIEDAIHKLELTRSFVEKELSGKAEPNNFNEIWNQNERKKIVPIKNHTYVEYGETKNLIRNMIVDCSVVDSIKIPDISANQVKDTVLITFFKTEKETLEILQKIGVDRNYTFYGENTISATWDVYEYLEREIPYLISMISTDISQLELSDILQSGVKKREKLPDPTTEPTIGVIDTLFDETAYFSNWVEYTEYLDEFENTDIKPFAYVHGTEVSSIIVDGPSLNPWLDDGCGRFKVRHFGVCQDRISVPRLVRKIKEIVKNNPDIHVWNLSLGTDDEVSKNFISYDAAALDELQAKRNVVFVVSGTNDNRDIKSPRLRIGSPADSLNSLVVNSVRRNGTPTSYTREGKVLSFFNKPDVSYYGGDIDETISAYAPYGEESVYGTSFAAPWISRKLCYLIDVIGLPRESSKAILIDAAAGWDYKKAPLNYRNLIGYGIVPIPMSRIMTTDSDEIKFIIHGTSQSYRTINNYIPVPRDSENKYPYIARAVMCYFPECSRNQGVDYTNRELSLKFGRIRKNGSIEDINGNVQDSGNSYVDEKKSRQEFRKWENTKLISKVLKSRNMALKSYDDKQWGLSVTSKERLSTDMKQSMNFGVVITLKEINGANRIREFISACNMRGWIVNEINVENRVNLYNQNQEEIVLE